MDVAVCMPWRAQPSRIPAFERVVAFWHDMGYPVHPQDSHPDRPFNRARARNLAVRRVDSDIVILADADTLPEVAAVRKAVNTIGEEIVWPYDRFRLVDQRWVSVKGDISGAAAVEGEDWQRGPVTGGVIVARRESYWRIGGFDERFATWGGEDTAFRCAANTLIGGRRIAGLLLGFNHRGTRDHQLTNNTLHAAYKEADLHPLAMLKLTTDRARFLDE